MALEGTHLIGYRHFYLIIYTQCVVCGGFASDPVDILSGVPQGTVLGPASILFLVYINDITDYVSSSCRLFADDCDSA